MWNVCAQSKKQNRTLAGFRIRQQTVNAEFVHAHCAVCSLHFMDSPQLHFIWPSFPCHHQASLTHVVGKITMTTMVWFACTSLPCTRIPSLACTSTWPKILCFHLSCSCSSTSLQSPPAKISVCFFRGPLWCVLHRCRMPPSNSVPDCWKPFTMVSMHIGQTHISLPMLPRARNATPSQISPGGA